MVQRSLSSQLEFVSVIMNKIMKFDEVTIEYQPLEDYFDNDYQLMPEGMLQCIPNLMGINLCSVKGIERICIGNQIVSLRIDFKPNVKAFE